MTEWRPVGRWVVRMVRLQRRRRELARLHGRRESGRSRRRRLGRIGRRRVGVLGKRLGNPA